jgi:hypothetical protein
MNCCETPIQDLANVIAHAQFEGFPEIEYESRDWSQKERVFIKAKRRHLTRDISVYAMFPQTWGSTALGFGGIGGQAITTAYTIVLMSEAGDGYCVYFGSRLAYRVRKPTQSFYEDIAQFNMKPLSECGVYERKVSE